MEKQKGGQQGSRERQQPSNPGKRQDQPGTGHQQDERDQRDRDLDEY